MKTILNILDWLIDNLKAIRERIRKGIYYGI